MTKDEIDAFVLEQVQLGAALIDSTASTYARGRYGVTPQYLATALRDELKLIHTGDYWPSVEVNASLRGLIARGEIIEAAFQHRPACGYLGAGSVRPVIQHRPRAVNYATGCKE